MKKSNKSINIQKHFRVFKEYSWDFNKMISYRRRKWLQIRFSNNLIKNSRYKVLNKRSFRSYKFLSQNIFKNIFAKNLSKRQTKKLFRVNYRYTSTTKRILKSEYRLDTLVYRLYGLPTIESARFLILSGFLTLNGYVNHKPNIILEPGFKLKPNGFLCFSFFYINLLKKLSTLKKYLNRIFFKFSYPFVLRQKKQLISEHGKKHKHYVLRFLGKKLNKHIKRRIYKKKYLFFHKSTSKKLKYTKYKLKSSKKNKKYKRLDKKVVYFQTIKINNQFKNTKILTRFKRKIKVNIKQKNKKIYRKKMFKTKKKKLRRKKIKRHLKKRASLFYFKRKNKINIYKKIRFCRIYYKNKNKLKKSIKLNKKSTFNLIGLGTLKRKKKRLFNRTFFKNSKLLINKHKYNIDTIYIAKKKKKRKFIRRMKKPKRLFSFYRLSKRNLILFRFFKSFNNTYKVFKKFKNLKNVKWTNLIKTQYILDKKRKKIQAKNKAIIIPMRFAALNVKFFRKNVIKIVRLKKKYIRVSKLFRNFLNYKLKLNLNQAYNKTIKIKYKELNLLYKNKPTVYYFLETNFITLENVFINDLDILNYPHQTFLNFKFMARLFGPRS